MIVVFAITLSFVAWLALPFFAAPSSKHSSQQVVERQRERLNVYYARVLRNLHDLDEDFATGKLDEDDYQAEREAWVQRGIAALEAMDALDSEHLIAPETADEAQMDAAIDQRIEGTLSETQPAALSEPTQ